MDEGCFEGGNKERTDGWMSVDDGWLEGMRVDDSWRDKLWDRRGKEKISRDEF